MVIGRTRNSHDDTRSEDGARDVTDARYRSQYRILNLRYATAGILLTLELGLVLIESVLIRQEFRRRRGGRPSNPCRGWCTIPRERLHRGHAGRIEERRG